MGIVCNNAYSELDNQINIMSLINTECVKTGPVQQGSLPCEYGEGIFSKKVDSLSFISVLVAVHNVAPYLDQCLNSLATQTLQRAEFIVIDDGSTDSSREICDKYQTMDARFKVIHQANLGTLCARKRAIEQARGHYCIFLDGDDFLAHPRVLEQLVKMLGNEPVDILQYRVNVIGENKSQIEGFRSWSGPRIDNQTIYSPKNILRACFVEERFRWSLVDKIFKISALKQAAKACVSEYFVMAEDIYLFFLIVYFSTSFKSVETEPLYTYRFGNGVSTQGVDLKKFPHFAKEIVLVEWLHCFLTTENQLIHYQEILNCLQKQRIDSILWRFKTLPVCSRSKAWDLIRQYVSAETLLPALYGHFRGQEGDLCDSLRSAQTLISHVEQVKAIGVFYPKYDGSELERNIAQQISLFLKMGYQVVLLLEKTDTLRECEIPSGVSKIVIPESYFEGRASCLKKVIEKFHIDVFVHHASSSENYLFDVIVVKSLGIPVVTVRNELSMVGMLQHDGAISKQIHTLQLTNAVIALSTMEETFYQSLGLKARYIPYSIRYLAATPRKSKKIGKTVLWVGRLDSLKNYKDALEIMKGLVARDSSFNCVMVGGDCTGGSAEYVQSYIHDNHLEDSVHWEGSVLDVSAYYRHADLLLVTSEAESFSMTIAEAMAYGLPIVCYELPYLELLKNNSGVLSVTQHDVPAAINAILKIFESKEAYTEYPKASRDAFVEFSKIDIADAWKKVFDEDIKSSPISLNEKQLDAWRFLDSTIAFYQKSIENLPVVEREKPLSYSQQIQLYRYGVLMKFVHKILPENSYRKKIVKAMLKPLFRLMK